MSKRRIREQKLGEIVATAEGLSVRLSGWKRWHGELGAARKTEKVTPEDQVFLLTTELLDFIENWLATPFQLAAKAASVAATGRKKEQV